MKLPVPRLCAQSKPDGENLAAPRHVLMTNSFSFHHFEAG
jgi:hypothetical protein